MILHNIDGLAVGGVVWMHLTDMPGDMHPCGEAAFPLDGDPFALIAEIHENGTVPRELCAHVVFEEMFHHLRYALRDLSLLGR